MQLINIPTDLFDDIITQICFKYADMGMKKAWDNESVLLLII